MTFDSRRCRTFLFGGGGAGNQGLDDTWEYDGNTWSQHYSIPSPEPRWAHAMTYDAAQEKVVLFGGYGPGWPGGQQLGDTWVYDGETWTQLYPQPSPEAREQHVMTYDSNRNRIVLFGGWTLGYYLNGDTWELCHAHKVFLPFVLSGWP